MPRKVTPEQQVALTNEAVKEFGDVLAKKLNQTDAPDTPDAPDTESVQEPTQETDTLATGSVPVTLTKDYYEARMEQARDAIKRHDETRQELAQELDDLLRLHRFAPEKPKDKDKA